MDLTRIDGEVATYSSKHSNDLISDKMTRLAYKNNLLSFKPMLLLQRLKVLMYPSNSILLKYIQITKIIAIFLYCLQIKSYHHHTTSLCFNVWNRKMSPQYEQGHCYLIQILKLDLSMTNLWQAS